MSKPKKISVYSSLIAFGLAVIAFSAFQLNRPVPVKIAKGTHISLIGNNLGSRMMNYDNFETELYMRYPDDNLIIRNMCDGGDTPGFRPHASRNTPWAFPGAEKFQTELANPSESEGHFETPDQWLTRLKTDVIVSFFGYNESFEGKAGLANYKAELDAFIKWTLQQKYNGTSAPQLVIVSPIAFEDLSAKYDLPNGKKENENLLLYTKAMKEVADQNKVLFVDAFTPSQKWYAETKEDLTIDGSQLNAEGYKKLGVLLVDKIFGKAPQKGKNRELVHAAVDEKNWMWHNDFKIPNGVHVYGRRYNPFGPDNYPAEIEKIRQLTDIRDQAIWLAASKGEKTDLAVADKSTRTLPQVKTNFNPDKNGSLTYLYGNDALAKLKVPAGYKIELFASEQEFPDLAKPMQMSFDNKGRLWVATMPSYPHYKPGDSKPNDKIIIFEDTNNDGKADKQSVFADGLHLPLGFEIAKEGVYVSQGTNLKLLTDTNGDGKADKEEILLSGFDDHDTHHNSHAFTVDPSGAIYSGEGVFLHTNVETSYGPVRATNGGFYRYAPQLKKLERTAQLSIPNPWGIAFDDWGQPFFAETSSPDVRWMLPGSVLPRYGEATHKSVQLVEDKHRVRPTSGLEFVSSRHFPDDIQGDFLINNTIGFLGTKEHTLTDEGTGYKSHHRQDLVVSEDRNFRPVDMEFAPDGSLYVIDWHNILIGHMQHNARDPLRDHSHGRIYRITYPSRPLVTPAKVDGASIEELLDNLKLPEYRTRYRTRRELRGRDASQVLAKLNTWVANLDKNDPRYEHHLLEGLWVSWGMDKVDQKLLKKVLKAKDYHARAAAVQVVRYTGHQVPDQADLLMQAVRDENSRVRLMGIVAASWIGKEKGLPILAEAKKMPLDDWTIHAFEAAEAHLKGENVKKEKQTVAATNLKGKDLILFNQGRQIYAKEGYCGTCHQPDGKGLEASGFPPLSGAWVTGSDERLIKIALKGLLGPIEVNGKKYPGQVPMTPFAGLLKDDEVAAVLTYVRNSFGNKGGAISPEKVKQVRAATEAKKDFYSPEQLLKDHPMEK
ncbi:mono/diheme cytochrome c family protein/glucose/arabinose dehydrogenase [Dyadobacter sp. BE34]|uniref:Mono/diheme cytochrome c family protein/glucose/arabinose dehydrogenase n=1 Tax=Dyadobacter fermentans TaxID=94254 RepID=A0ABU1QTC0_9BACT|nr:MULTISPECIES: PVC-type heme-binding CxxCH protein [Dyadobacter]MDR6803990.1 mono/diheme cytochrome c family protein/glucose/arabinose dehydrogenase [Dyadobacter fermentans]MDR7041730.1 mono/diheme cytochrome c family protein/glucose/arabinose dehydrogenase [Dyadobacter sp. BE242]MDR7196133.1 mono/diheme cytochrome c family protein/glucose/arabinose dehydrogenase [Dyadobacter sp. BE34]MDR7213322.1 mono/diheme cytochrome c family protein/glucose/arabinose dehydrogenase [Dyadobacter sp. BE31]M